MSTSTKRDEGESAGDDSDGGGSAAEEAPLRFDKADIEAAPDAIECASCKRVITSSYYQINAALACAECHELVVREIASRDVNSRFMRAFAFGACAAVLGSIVWYAIREATGYEIGLISIGIGILVGIAVRHGSGGFGGKRYQALAVTLTYLSITMTNVPVILKELRDQAASEEAASSWTPAGEPDAVAAPVEPAGAPDPASSPPAQETSSSEEPSLSGFLLAWAIILGIALAAPFLAGFSNIIGIAILAFGLYEAWKINKHVPPAISGPFTVADGPRPTEPAASSGG